LKLKATLESRSFYFSFERLVLGASNLDFIASTCSASPWQRVQLHSNAKFFRNLARRSSRGSRLLGPGMNKVPEAVNFRALAQKNQLKILESKDALSIMRVIWRLLGFDSIILG
jgi:hypothetical protein